MEIFNLVCISLVLLEYSTLNIAPPNFLFIPSLSFHVFSQVFYIWIIVFSSFMECICYFLDCYKNYMLFVPILDEYIVGTLLNIIVCSGVILSKIKYGKTIPRHIQKVIQELQNLGLFWFILDKTTQQITYFDTFFIRTCINLFSCYKIYQIQKLMIKK